MAPEELLRINSPNGLSDAELHTLCGPRHQFGITNAQSACQLLARALQLSRASLQPVMEDAVCEAPGHAESLALRWPPIGWPGAVTEFSVTLWNPVTKNPADWMASRRHAEHSNGSPERPKFGWRLIVTESVRLGRTRQD